jgi:hypothetical protein
MFSIFLYFTGRPNPQVLNFSDLATREGVFDLIKKGMDVTGGVWGHDDIAIRTDKLDFIAKS